MASSGSKTFDLALADIIDEAFDRAGIEDYTGEDYRTARRSLNLLLTDWMNRGVNLWTLSLVSQTLTTGVNQYTLPTTVVDVLDAVVRDSDNLDTIAERIGIQEYLRSRTDKTADGKVVQYAVQRNAAGGHTLYTWPETDDSDDKLVYWAISYMDDFSATGGEQTANVPKRFLPALVAGLAWHILLKKKNKTQEDFAMIPILQVQYQDTLNAAIEEDRERASFFITPFVGRI